MTVSDPEATVVTSESTVTTSEPPLAVAEPAYATPQPLPATTPQTSSASSTTVTREPTAGSTGGAEAGRRLTIFAFGLIQIVIAARIVLLAVDAREGNGLVSGILNISQVFVGPFEGVLRTDALAQGGSIFDLAAAVALAGWTVLELIVIWALGMFRRQSA